MNSYKFIVKQAKKEKKDLSVITLSVYILLLEIIIK